MSAKSSSLKTFLSLSIGTFLLLMLVSVGLPVLFLLLQVPSFAIGDQSFWLLHWENTAEGSGIQFNVVLLLIIAIVVGLVGLVLRQRRR